MKLNIRQNGVSYGDWFVLAHICRGPIDGYAMSDISLALSLSLPQLTKVCARLTERKLIKQKQSHKDARKKLVRCTTAGKNLCETIELDLDAAAAEWLSKLSASQQAEYFSMMRILEQNRPKYIGMRGATIVTVKH
jgi:DNA-binding MarR family transcriptional regulator